MRTALLSSVFLFFLFFFCVCVTDDEEIGTNNNINTIVNLYKLHAVDNTCTSHECIYDDRFECQFFSVLQNRSKASLLFASKKKRFKFALKSNLRILKMTWLLLFSFFLHEMITNFAVLSISCGYNHWY